MDNRGSECGAPAAVHVVAGLGREHGGTSYSVPALASALADAGRSVTLRALTGVEAAHAPSPRLAIVVHKPVPGPYGALLRASSDMMRALDGDARAGAILHAHGLWLLPNVYPARAKARSGCAAKLVHSPRGMLSREARSISAWKKTPFWLLLQRSALGAADCLHATAPAEYEEIRGAGLRAPVAVIPNGVDLPELGEAPRAAGRERVALSLGRLHPKKGLDRLVRAWSTLEAEFPDWRLRIVGPAELGYDAELRRLAGALGTTRLSIEPPLFGDARLAAYRSADLFLTPTLNENFGLTVAEALAAELPVIATKGAPWPDLQSSGCGWWVDHGPPLAAAMREAMTLPRGELHAMGARGRAWMARDFSWARAAAEMLAVYRWLARGGAPPATVRLD